MLRNLIRWFSARQTKVAHARQTSTREGGRRAYLRVERLEGRDAPTVLTATNQASLAADITYFDNNPGVGNVIQIQAGYIPLTSALPQVTQSMEIDGLPGGSIIGSMGVTLPFRILLLGTNGNAITLKNLIIQGGSARQSDFSGNGGGIYSLANLTMDGCTVNYCSAAGHGGGLYNTLAPLTLNGCTFTHDSAGNNGGAVDVENGSGAQTLDVQGGLFSNNTAVHNGGGIYYDGDGNVIVSSCHMFQNVATAGSGGAIYSRSYSLQIRGGTSSVLSANRAGATGGAIYTCVVESFTADASVRWNSAANGATSGAYILLGPSATYLLSGLFADTYLAVTT